MERRAPSKQEGYKSYLQALAQRNELRRRLQVHRSIPNCRLPRWDELTV